MKREVNFVKVHQAFHVIGAGNFKEALSYANYPALKMFWDDGHVYCAYKGVEFVIPGPNVAVAAFVKEAPKAEAPKSKGGAAA